MIILNNIDCYSIEIRRKSIYFVDVNILNKVNTKPYKIREKAEKDANYRGLIRAELADELYDGILTIVVAQKKYRDPDYSAKQLAEDLKTNPRYLSAVINSRFGMNYSSLVNEFRVRDAVHMLTDKRFLDLTMEEIGRRSGFANRQSFYAAFFKEKGEAPHQYKKRHLSK